MRFFGLKTCDTCRKALKTLAAEGYAPEVVDVRADGVSEADLNAFWDAFGEDLINRRSTTWRGLGESERTQEPIALLKTYPTLMKRPVIEADDRSLTLGWPRKP